MNDLMRPALYDAFHDILPVQRVPSPQPSPASVGGSERDGQSLIYEVVGPVCESGDFLGHARQLGVAAGDVLAVMSAGAYGMSMSSNYNTRPRAAEVLVDGARIHLVREREPVLQLFAGEKIIE